MRKLILITGARRSGKDTVAKMIQKDLYANLIDITCKLKEVVAKMFNVSPEWLDENKDETFEFFGQTFSIRHFLQHIGNDIAPGLFMTKNYWLDHLQSHLVILKEDNVIISGVRLTNEVEYLRTMNPQAEVIVIKVIRENFQAENPQDDLHNTELQVNLIKSDYTITASNMEELIEGVNKLHL